MADLVEIAGLIWDFAGLECEGCVWDLKRPLRNWLWFGHAYWTPVRGDPAPERLFYDVWSNIHYGYVGRAMGFNDWLLNWGASTFGGVNTASDRASVQLGITLWDTYGRNLTKGILAGRILALVPTYRSDPGDDDTYYQMRIPLQGY